VTTAIKVKVLKEIKFVDEFNDCKLSRMLPTLNQEIMTRHFVLRVYLDISSSV
jgi:hypothetical protein